MSTKNSAAVHIERSLLDDVSVDAGWSLIERFSTLVRESGMPDEHTAANYIAGQLESWGVEFEMHALGRTIQPEEVANLVLFLASDESSGITGQAIVVDGGLISGCDLTGIPPLS